VAEAGHREELGDALEGADDDRFEIGQRTHAGGTSVSTLRRTIRDPKPPTSRDAPDR
jgi:hypothetical protein